MLFYFFYCFLVLSFIMFFAGRYNSVPVLEIASSGFVFLLGMVLMGGGVVVESGYTESLVFDDDNVTVGSIVVTDYSGLAVTSLAGGVKVEHTIGFFLGVLGVFMFMSVMSHLGRGVKYE